MCTSGALAVGGFSQRVTLALFCAIPDVRMEIWSGALWGLEAGLVRPASALAAPSSAASPTAPVAEGYRGWPEAMLTVLLAQPTVFQATPHLVAVTETWLSRTTVGSLPLVTVRALVALAADVPCKPHCPEQCWVGPKWGVESVRMVCHFHSGAGR